MKTINTIQDALVYQLQGLYYSESKIKSEFITCEDEIASTIVQNEIRKYVSISDDKTLKLQRCFNYLMHDEFSRKNDVINKLIDETHRLLECANSTHLKDILIIGCIQNINAYKIASYRTAYLFSVELELDTVSDLLQQILEWEQETSKILGTLSIVEFNNLARNVESSLAP